MQFIAYFIIELLHARTAYNEDFNFSENAVGNLA